jgi:hypothetical protein
MSSQYTYALLLLCSPDDLTDRWHEYRPLLRRLRDELHRCVYVPLPPTSSSSSSSSLIPPSALEETAAPSYFSLVRILRKERARLLQQVTLVQGQLETLRAQSQRADAAQSLGDSAKVYMQKIFHLERDLQERDQAVANMTAERDRALDTLHRLRVFVLSQGQPLPPSNTLDEDVLQAMAELEARRTEDGEEDEVEVVDDHYVFVPTPDVVQVVAIADADADTDTTLAVDVDDRTMAATPSPVASPTAAHTPGPANPLVFVQPVEPVQVLGLVPKAK